MFRPLGDWLAYLSYSLHVSHWETLYKTSSSYAATSHLISYITDNIKMLRCQPDLGYWVTSFTRDRASIFLTPISSYWRGQIFLSVVFDFFPLFFSPILEGFKWRKRPIAMAVIYKLHIPMSLCTRHPKRLSNYKAEKSNLKPTSTVFFSLWSNFGQHFHFFVHNVFFSPPHQSSWILFNRRNYMKEKIEFWHENCTHPGKQVVSYLINYWRVISLPNGSHLIWYVNWNLNRRNYQHVCVQDLKKKKKRNAKW